MKKVILLGSGGLSIGQAGEFDYSGFQAIRSLEEEGLEVVIINPNIATVQTTPSEKRKIYLYPVEPEWVEKVIEIEKPDGIIAGFGGQTALNCVIRLEDLGILTKHNVKNLGTAVEILRLTEDRDLFAKKMIQNAIPVPPSLPVITVSEALQAAEKIGYPVIARAAFALGGLGSGFAKDANELQKLVELSLSHSPQVLIEKSLKGWKEVEYEVMRDSYGNAITICNMENFDPLGIHTGDSIVVAPSQTLTDSEFQLLRNISLKIVQLLGIVGECNVQFALNPQSLEFYVIEINARLSRSSALASKATGYPIAFIAAKVVLGKNLIQIRNPLTQVTSAYFEPALDYIVVKIPRWDLAKFKGASREIGTAMKSVGEVMSIGRTFPEALQKAIRMVSEEECGYSTFSDSVFETPQSMDHIQNATDTRLFKVIQALRQGMSIERIAAYSQIDAWFLQQISEMVDIEREIYLLGQEMRKDVEGLPYQQGSFLSLLRDHLPKISKNSGLKWKRNGFGDEQIALILCRSVFSGVKKIPKSEILEASQLIRKWRKEKGIQPVFRKIDTSAAEFPSFSNYLYTTYGGESNDVIEFDSIKKRALILGGGSYRIGSSVEFDWCAVSAIEKVKELGWSASVINFNPETVSTDYNVSDRLYFEEMTLERILDVVEFEQPEGVILSMGGQLPNKLAPHLAGLGVQLLGHQWNSIDQAEDREKFSALLDQISVLQPEWIEARSRSSVQEFVQKVGYPILIRPSYVLSGSAMNVAVDDDSLDLFLSLAKDLSQEHPVILTKFYEGALEVELDGVARNGELLISFVSEHIENAGVHSGDASMVFPPQSLSICIQEQIKETGRQIARHLNLNGPFNVQFLVKNEKVQVIECNVRASRSFPFISKVVGVNLIHMATEAMISPQEVVCPQFDLSPNWIGVKSAMFSFHRLSGADPVLGVEMASTGEVACLGKTLHDAVLLSFQASGIKIPRKGVLMSAGRVVEKHKLLAAAHLISKLGLPIYATSGTAQFMKKQGIEVIEVQWDSILSTINHLIREDKIDMVINIPKNYTRSELSQGYQIRLLAVRTGSTLFTNAEKANIFLESVVSASASLKDSPLLECKMHHLKAC